MIKCHKENTAEKAKENAEDAILIERWLEDMDCISAGDVSMKLEVKLVSAVMNNFVKKIWGVNEVDKYSSRCL